MTNSLYKYCKHKEKIRESKSAKISSSREIWYIVEEVIVINK